MVKTITAGDTGSVNKWDVLEIEAMGFDDKNPFTDYQIKGEFTGKGESVAADGFYDGGGVYKVRFMPSFEGEYRYKISGGFSGETKTGSFTVTPPQKNNRGPVRVANKYHFAYADGTPFYPMGTTCYAWTHQPPETQAQTMEELKKGWFNKIRFCVFPKHYVHNLREPQTYPYEGAPMDSSKLTPENFNDYNSNHSENDWDFTKFNPGHFRLFEQRIGELAELGVEADIIVMHPYDRWGFSNMGAGNDDLYWKYVIARFSAFRNVWWSLANEYDFMQNKTVADWERYAALICEKDPYNHLRSIHNALVFYDHNRPWVTHCSIQSPIVEKTAEWRDQYGKPAVFDEMVYEGNIEEGFGRLSAKELVRRFWECAVRGGYGGHGETYKHPEDIIWWSHGGKLHGESPERIKFLLGLLCETPGFGFKQYRPNEEGFAGVFCGGAAAAMPAPYGQPTAYLAFGCEGTVAVPEGPAPEGSYFLVYFGNMRPASFECSLGGAADYEIEVIDTWDMTIQKTGAMRGKIRIELPEKEYMAVRIRKTVNI